MIPPLTLEIFVVCLGIFLLMLDAFSPTLPKRVIAWTGILGLLVVFFASFYVARAPAVLSATGLYTDDPLGMFFKRLMPLSAALTLLLAMDYAPAYLRYLPTSRNSEGLSEYLILPLFACAGLMWLCTAADFIMIFVALELVTITFFVLVASMRMNKPALEAGVKYLILGALSTGFLVYGITWIFGMTGRTSLDAIASVLPALAPASRLPLLFGFGLVLVALGFKTGAFPFQFWIPDVYQGAPTPTMAYLSVASKSAGVVVLIRVVQAFLESPTAREPVLLSLTVLAGMTLLFGNLAAMPQTNFKRLLAYSSIAHAGYLLLGVASVSSGSAGTAVSFYLFGYLLMTFSAFFALVLVAGASGADEISDFNGLSRRSPLLAFHLTIAMLSLAGLPFTVGFLGKYLIFESAVRAGLYVLVGIGVITVASGFYYYLKVVRAAYWQSAPEAAPAIILPLPTRITLLLLSAATLIFGVFPQPILALLR